MATTPNLVPERTGSRGRLAPSEHHHDSYSKRHAVLGGAWTAVVAFAIVVAADGTGSVMQVAAMEKAYQNRVRLHMGSHS